MLLVLCSGCSRNIQSDSKIKEFIINTDKKECEQSNVRIPFDHEQQHLIDFSKDNKSSETLVALDSEQIASYEPVPFEDEPNKGSYVDSSVIRVTIDEELNGYKGIEGLVNVLTVTEHNKYCCPRFSDRQLVVFKGDSNHCAAVAKIFENRKVRQERIMKEEIARANKLRLDKEQIEKQIESVRKLTPEYKASEAAGQIRYAKRSIQSANKAIAEEKEIGAISGAMNFDRLHQAGEIIVFSNSVIKSQWGIYKANGGKASSVDELLASSNK